MLLGMESESVSRAKRIRLAGVFFAVLLAQMICGCTAYHYFTEAELLTAMRGAAGTGPLSSHPQIQGTPVFDPSFLLGKWQATVEEEGLTCGFMSTKRTPPLSKGNTSYVREYDFKSDGTYSLSVSRSIDGYPPVTTEFGGTWSLHDGKLTLVESRLTETSGLPRIKNIKNGMQVVACSQDEISIQFASSADWMAAVRATNSQMQSFCEQNYPGKNTLYNTTNNKFECGWDNRGYAVIRHFHAVKDGKGFMFVTATPPCFYKRMGQIVTSATSSSQLTRPPVQSAPSSSQRPQRAPSAPPPQQPVSRPAAAVTVTPQPPPQSVSPPQPAYSLESLKWDERKDFECQFTIKMNSECSIEAFFEIQQKFEENLRSAYLRMHPGVNAGSLVVDVRPALDNGRISGRAAVLTIAPESLSYDAVTRRGRLSVRFNPGQAEEARAWIRGNIETLARDKNIRLVTGQLPPAATYYSLDERIEGNVMEIEFKTE